MTSLPRLKVVNALLAEWREKRVPLSRHRLYQADPNAKEDLELYLNYVEMLKAEGVTLESDMDALKIGPVAELNDAVQREPFKDITGQPANSLPHLFSIIYPKDMLEKEYGMKSVWTVPRLIDRSKVPLPVIFKTDFPKDDASERLSWLNRLALDHPSKDSCYLCALISGDIYNSVGGEYQLTAEVFYGMAYSLASTAAQRALSLSRLAIVMAKLKSTERKWLGRVLVGLAERQLDGSNFDDSRISTYGEFMNSIKSAKMHLVSSSLASPVPDIIDRDVLGISIPPIDFLDARRVDKIDQCFLSTELFPPNTVKFYQKRFIASYLCFSSFFLEGLESGCDFAKAKSDTLGINPGSFDFLRSHCLQYVPLLANDTSANVLKKMKSKPAEPSENDN